MAVQHEDIIKLRKESMISSVWTPSQVAPHVDDNYTNATVANHSACPCGKLVGYHCTFNTASHRFVRLGNGKYCLPEESPDICPIHKVKSVLASNPYITQFPSGRATPAETNNVSSHEEEDFQTTSAKLGQLVFEVGDAISRETVNDDLVSQFRRRLSSLGFEYNSTLYPALMETENFNWTVMDSPCNLAEALLWKLGKWKTYTKFSKYYEDGENTQRGRNIILYAFAIHLRDRSQPIIDQHTIRSMWAIDSSLTHEEKEACKAFLIKRNGTWKQSGSGVSGQKCYHCYVRLVDKLGNLGVDVSEADKLLMPLGRALRQLAKNHKEFRRLCGHT